MLFSTMVVQWPHENALLNNGGAVIDGDLSHLFLPLETHAYALAEQLLVSSDSGTSHLFMCDRAISTCKHANRNWLIKAHRELGLQKM